MKALLLAALVALIRGTFATLVIKGPTEPLLEEEPVQLECLYMDSNLNVTQVHFEFQPQGSEVWRRVWGSSLRRYYSNYGRGLYSMKEEENTGLLDIPYPMTYSGAAFRCVSENENVTAPDNVSQPLTFKVQYLSEPTLYMEEYSRYRSAPELLEVYPGDNVTVKCYASSSEKPIYYWRKEGDDWILPSSILTVKNMRQQDEGEYTCMVEHPSMKSLTKKRTIYIRTVYMCILPRNFGRGHGGHILLTISAAAVSLLVFIVSLTVFLCRRAKRIRTSKGPIDDRSQKKPIYKTSVESLPSTCTDNQPLV